MKIGFVAHPFYGSPESVSTHIWIHEVARRLPTTWSAVVYMARQDSKPVTETHDGVQYCRISIPSEIRPARLIAKQPIVRRFRGRISFRSRWYYCGYALQIARALRAEKCELIHIDNLPQFAPTIRALNPRAKIILHLHVSWLMGMDSRRLARWLRSIDLVAGCSDFVTGQIRSAFPQFAARCTTLYNGVDVERFIPNSDSSKQGSVRRLLYVGNIDAYKGVHVLLDAMPEVLRHHADVRLDIVGRAYQLPFDWLRTLGEPAEIEKLRRFYDGRGYLAHLKEQISRLHLNDSVEFHGCFPYREIAQAYHRADVLVLPSVCSEGFGMPAAEAMSSGLPVVASRVGGLPEVVQHGETGLLVPPRDSSALASALIRLLEDEGLRRSMGQAGRERVLRTFTWDAIAEAFVMRSQELTASETNQQRGPRGASSAICAAKPLPEEVAEGR